jgi:hypothetical protein
MDSYTITIAPNDDSGAATRLVVDTSGDQVRITDVHLHAPHGLSSGHIPTVDFDLLLQAVTGTVTAPTGRTAAGTPSLTTPPPGTPALEAPARPDERQTPPPPGRRARATSRAAATPAKRQARTRTATAAPGDGATAPRRPARAATTATRRNAAQTPANATRAATAKATPAPAKKQTAVRTAAPAKSQAPGKRRRAAADTAAAAPAGRVYRRTPDDLAAVLQQVGTVAGIAAHYQVPRYTAQGWVTRLRATA